MAESWRNLMDIGLVHFMAVPGIIKDEGLIVESAAKIAEDDFFSVLEVRRSKNPEVMQGLKQVADSAHMSLGVGAQPGLLLGKLSLNNPDEGGRRAAIEEVKQSLDAAYFFGSRLCVVVTGPDPGEAERERGLDLLVASCEELCQYCKDQAKDYVCYLSVEQFDDKHDKKCLIGPSDITARLAERVRESHDNFGITVDLSHIPMIGENHYDWLGTLQPYIVHVHAGNCLISSQEDVAYGDMHPRFGYPGGENDLPELKAYLEALIYIGYFQSEVPTGKPIFTFEVKPYGNDTTELVLANTKRVFKEAWAQLQA